MRILASADIHLGSPIRSLAMRNPDLSSRLVRASQTVFACVIDLAIKEAVDVLVLAGDLFDTGQPDVRLQAFLLAQLGRAQQAGVQSVLIRGNHDALLDHTRFGQLGAGIHLLDRARSTVVIEDVAFHGLSFDTAHKARSFLPDYPAPDPARRNVGLMHSSLGGAEGHDPYAPCSEADLLAHGYDLWCLGHIHAPFERRTEGVLAVMPGIPQPRHFGERRGGQVALCELTQGETRLCWMDVAQLAFSELDVDLTQIETSALDVLSSALRRAARPGAHMAVRLNVMTDSQTSEDLTALALQCLEDIPGVYLDKIRLHMPEAAGTGETDDLERLMREEMRSDAFALARDALLSELREALPPGARGAVDVDDALLEEALGDVLRQVRAAG